MFPGSGMFFSCVANGERFLTGDKPISVISFLILHSAERRCDICSVSVLSY